MRNEDYKIRFEPVAGTGDGQLYSISRPDPAAAIKLAKIKHTFDYPFPGARQVISSVHVWNWIDSCWDDITAEVELNG